MYIDLKITCFDLKITPKINVYWTKNNLLILLDYWYRNAQYNLYPLLPG